MRSIIFSMHLRNDSSFSPGLNSFFIKLIVIFYNFSYIIFNFRAYIMKKEMEVSMEYYFLSYMIKYLFMPSNLIII